MANEEKTTKKTELRVQLFTHQEILAQLLRLRGITEGRWQLVYELGHVATTVNAIIPGQTEPVRVPVGMVLIQKVGIAPTREVSELTLDAADLSKPRKRVTRGTPKTKAKK